MIGPPRNLCQSVARRVYAVAPRIRVRPPGGFLARTSKAIRLRMPPVNQFRLHDTYWASRYGVVAQKLVAARGNVGKPALQNHLAALTAAVEAAPYSHSKHNAAPIRAAHKRLQKALAQSGTGRRDLRALDRRLRTYESWWKTSGATACALAAERALNLAAAKPTRMGRFTRGTRRRWFSKTPLYAGYQAQRRRRPARLYKGRYITYEVRYSRTRLTLAARRIMSRLRAGQPVHARVLTGYLHRDSGRRPKASHSLVIDGYTLTSGTAQKPQQVQLHFIDPDGGGDGVLHLDVAKGRFEHLPARLGWHDRGSYGWDYGSAAPPHRYQVLSVR